MRPRGWLIVLAFLYIWLMVGFATGTATLLGPAQWVTALVRGRGLERLEDPAMWALIAAFVVASFLLSRLLVLRMFRTQHRTLRWAIPSVATAAAGVALWGWTNPALYASVAGGAVTESVATATGAEFVFGPYPDRERLAELKEQGFTAVVSLQHPAVIPFEPQGIAAEKAAAAELGLQFIHAPMLPWVSDNEASLNIVRELAAGAAGKYYVHCGLGRDRVNVVRRVLELEGARLAGEAEGLLEATTFADRDEPFERGAVHEVEPGVWLIPYPNEHEFFGYILAGQVGHVVLALDPADPEQAVWIDEANALLRNHGIPATPEPPATGPAGIEALLEAARPLERPVAIIVPFTPPHERAPFPEQAITGESDSPRHR